MIMYFTCIDPISYHLIQLWVTTALVVVRTILSIVILRRWLISQSANNVVIIMLDWPTDWLTECPRLFHNNIHFWKSLIHVQNGYHVKYS